MFRKHTERHEICLNKDGVEMAGWRRGAGTGSGNYLVIP